MPPRSDAPRRKTEEDCEANRATDTVATYRAFQNASDRKT